MPRTHRTIAVVVVRSAKAFAWLGHMPIMNWSVKRLGDVRGLDRVVCVADGRLRDRSEKLLAKEEIEVVSIPQAITKKPDREFDRWLCAATGPAAEADVVLVLQPTSPFMPAAKIEAVLDTVASKAADVSCTARVTQAYAQPHPAAGLSRMLAYAEVSTCRAFAPARVTERGVGKFKPVTVDLVESLDVSVPDNLRVAAALVPSARRP